MITSAAQALLLIDGGFALSSQAKHIFCGPNLFTAVRMLSDDLREVLPERFEAVFYDISTKKPYKHSGPPPENRAFAVLDFRGQRGRRIKLWRYYDHDWNLVKDKSTHGTVLSLEAQKHTTSETVAEWEVLEDGTENILTVEAMRYSIGYSEQLDTWRPL